MLDYGSLGWENPLFIEGEELTSFAEARESYFRIVRSVGSREFSIDEFKRYLRAEGFEKVCLYCAGELSGRRRSYCCDLCKINFQVKFVFTHSWQSIRNEYIKTHPNCERCGKKAVEVHHKEPIRKYRSFGIQGDVFDEDNLESCCSGCHKKAGRELAEEVTVLKILKRGKMKPLDDYLENPQQ